MKMACYPQSTPLEFYPVEGRVGNWLPSTLNYSSQVVSKGAQIVSKGAQDLLLKWGTVVCGEQG